MSQLETLMLVGLGFAVALLLALIAGRFAWNTAIKLGARRRQQNAPAAVLEIQTDRDRLRAEYAVMSRKLELRMDDLKARLVEQMAEVSRNRNRILSLAEENEEKTKTVAERDGTIAAQAAKIAELETALAAKAAELQATLEKHAGIEAQDKLRSEELGILRDGIARRDAQIEELKNDLAAQPIHPQGLEAVAAAERLRRRIASLSALSGEIAEQRVQLQIERDKVAEAVEAGELHIPAPVPRIAVGDRLEARLNEAEREADEIGSELKKLDEAWSRKLKNSIAAAPVELPVPSLGFEPMPSIGGLLAASKSAVAIAVPAPDPEAIAAAEEPAAAPPPRKQAKREGRTNVISLAQRIRALKQDMAI